MTFYFVTLILLLYVFQGLLFVNSDFILGSFYILFIFLNEGAKIAPHQKENIFLNMFFFYRNIYPFD